MRIRTPLLSECITDAWLGKHIEKQRYRETQALAAATADDLATIKMRGKRKALPAAVLVDALIAIPAYLRALRAFTSIATSVTTILHVLIALSRQLRPVTVFARDKTPPFNNFKANLLSHRPWLAHSHLNYCF